MHHALSIVDQIKVRLRRSDGRPRPTSFRNPRKFPKKVCLRRPIFLIHNLRGIWPNRRPELATTRLPRSLEAGRARRGANRICPAASHDPFSSAGQSFSPAPARRTAMVRIRARLAGLDDHLGLHEVLMNCFPAIAAALATLSDHALVPAVMSGSFFMFCVHFRVRRRRWPRIHVHFRHRKADGSSTELVTRLDPDRRSCRSQRFRSRM